MHHVDIFNYVNASLYLRDTWLKKKENNPNFSIRSWANNLGIKSHTQLHQVLNGKRNLPSKYIISIAKNLKLTTSEADYFEKLVKLQAAKSEEERLFYLQSIQKNNESIEVYEVDSYELIRSPLNFFILELFCLIDGQLTPLKIQKSLIHHYPLNEIRKSVELLTKLKMLIVKDGSYRKAHGTVFTANDIPNLAKQEYHKNIAELAKEAVSKQAPLEREFSGFTFGIKAENLPQAKEELRKFRAEFSQKFIEKDFEGNQLYHLAINFFAISNKVE
ncbi:TIGR02147 family protein [Halobacteriovorax sp. Y22]|uniref:TIGR02147 family protein n=1 Tax=Halobacteriovorax sp. Y22 TaxID=2505978 RepID=UPI0010800FB0|nr:TIGR02147 family protein [Halobacteriovorax sp. Y22]TGD47962.1 TIGR02147 family protein [Halobacteriovorax sp. Y22]